MGDELPRRTYLGSLVPIALAGCLSGDEPIPGLGEVEIQNFQTRDVEADVTIAKDGEVRYEETLELEAAGDGVIRGSEQIVEPWMGDRTLYEVSITVAGIGTETYSTDDFTEMFDSWDEAPCYILDANINSEFIGFSVGVDEPCPPGTRKGDIHTEN